MKIKYSTTSMDNVKRKCRVSGDITWQHNSNWIQDEMITLIKYKHKECSALKYTMLD
jgi:hypothetical protein